MAKTLYEGVRGDGKGLRVFVLGKPVIPNLPAKEPKGGSVIKGCGK